MLNERPAGWRRIARSTPGMSGADLADALNEAALGAAQAGHERIGQHDIEQAIEKVMAGMNQLREPACSSGMKFPRATRHGSLALACWASALLAGCLALRTPEPGASVRVEAGEALVFGRVRAFELGYEITPWMREGSEILAEDPEVRLALLHVESGRKRPDVPISADGRFEWILPAGTYLLYHTPSIEPPFNEPLAAFQAAPGPNPNDLGELHLAISVGRTLSSTPASYTLLHVDARAGNSESAASFLQRFPGSSPVRQGAVVVDPELGGLFTNWSQEACARILRRHGMEIGRFGGR